MYSNWSALRAQLVRSVNRHSALIHFCKLFPSGGSAPTSREPGQLLDWLQNKSVDPDAKNNVLTHLLRSAIGGETCSDLAAELLILALWPGLCVVRHRLRTLCRSGSLDADLLSGLAIGIGSADPERVKRVAATLLRNLERDLRREYHGAHKTSRLDLHDIVSLHEPSDHTDGPEILMKAAEAALGEDGYLLTAVHIAGFSQKEAAEQLGISHDAARKRCQRAIARLQDSSGV
ncbi:sigma-70 family RNA polymerase sigma factor [Thalassococcus profundi]|uniref:sigma-70 family RNA polymerase sigma factor n=1 Tax=Thalassococcus profundi TaxID=2282382 RepID=UPI0011C01891|nr:sigma-70 family RNA polymerase sigma factor [Thalassococcus profundi]